MQRKLSIVPVCLLVFLLVVLGSTTPPIQRTHTNLTAPGEQTVRPGDTATIPVQVSPKNDRKLVNATLSVTASPGLCVDTAEVDMGDVTVQTPFKTLVTVRGTEKGTHRLTFTVNTTVVPTSDTGRSYPVTERQVSTIRVQDPSLMTRIIRLISGILPIGEKQGTTRATGATIDPCP